MSCDTVKELEEIVIDWIKNWKFAKKVGNLVYISYLDKIKQR